MINDDINGHIFIADIPVPTVQRRSFLLKNVQCTKLHLNGHFPGEPRLASFLIDFLYPLVPHENCNS